ncbi:MAG: hypothetical protein QG584_52 [Pseudomonadota bacterium]|nr:hypothetical protein [Pseudomonadota bacterium]
MRTRVSTPPVIPGSPVIPAKAGIQYGRNSSHYRRNWTPAPQGHFLRGAFAGMTGYN